MPVGPKLCTLDGKAIKSLDDLYDELGRQLVLPDYFGRNLDALWDVLSADIPGPFEIIWKNTKTSKQAMTKDFDKVVKLLRDLEKERTDFRFVLEQ